MANDQDKKSLNIVFNQLDKNKDGFLTKEELINGWNQAFATSIADFEIEKIF